MQPVVTYAGHLYPWKGVDVLMRALVLLPDVRGVIVGGHPSEADRRRLEALLATLTDKQRQAVLLKFSGGLSYREIAEVMALSVSHVGVLLHTALGRLRARWVEPAELVTLEGEP